DGALHSVLFGQTMALKLNVDDTGVPIATGDAHVLIESADSELHTLRVHEHCVETWINMASDDTGAGRGGGILGICPTSTGFDVNLWIAADGILHYRSHTHEHDGWHGMHVRSVLPIGAGRWHHIAVSRSLPPRNSLLGSRDRVVVYVDGQPV